MQIYSDAQFVLLASKGWRPEQIAQRTDGSLEAINKRARFIGIDFQSELQKSWRRGNYATIATTNHLGK